MKDKLKIVFTAILELIIFYAVYGIIYLIGAFLGSIISFFDSMAIFVPQLLAVGVACVVIAKLQDKKEIFYNATKIFSITLIVINIFCLIINIVGIVKHMDNSLEMLISNVVMIIAGIAYLKEMK